MCEGIFLHKVCPKAIFITMVKKKVNEKISYLYNMKPATFCKEFSQTVS